MENTIKIVECPRDAMQGLHNFIPTEQKIKYINSLLKVGFDTLDFGSFVSPKAIPQMRDTKEVLAHLDLEGSKTKLLAIVANVKGAEMASEFPQIKYLGYPFSISETFQRRNTNKGIADSIEIVKELLAICQQAGQELVVYISMGFGNPYGEEWSVEVVEKYTDLLASLGVKIVSLSDTIGASNPKSIEYLFGNLIHQFPKVEIGAHLHTTPDTWHEKILAAHQNGCRRFDGAIRGLGGCPFAKDELVGNMPTEKLLTFAAEHKLETGIHPTRFETAMNVAFDTFQLN